MEKPTRKEIIESELNVTETAILKLELQERFAQTKQIAETNKTAWTNLLAGVQREIKSKNEYKDFLERVSKESA